MALKINTTNQLIFKNNSCVKTSKTDIAAPPSLAKKSEPTGLNRGYYPPLNFKADEHYLFTNDLKNLEDVHCPICGVTMLSHEKYDSLIKEGMRIVSVKNFVNWLESSREHIPVKYQRFVESAKRNSEEFGASSVEVLFQKMKDTAVIASNNALDDMKKIIVDAQKKYDFTDSENVLLDECFVRLEEFDAGDYSDITRPAGKILYETVGAIEKADAKKLYSALLMKLTPAAEYQKLFSDEKCVNRSIPYKKRVLQNVFGSAHSNVQKVITNFAEDRKRNVNSLLVCKECLQPRANSLFAHYQYKEDLAENFKKYLEDIAQYALDDKLGKNTSYPLELIKYTKKVTSGKLDINKYESPILKTLNTKVFHQEQKKIDFEPLKHSGIPCACCGDLTITHEDKLKLFEEIEQTKDLKELVKFVNDHEQIINTRYKPLIKVFQNKMQNHPDISEKELINDLKLYASERLKYQLEDNVRHAEQYTIGLNSKDKKLIQKYIDDVNNKFLKLSDYKKFPYKEYSELLKNSIYLVSDYNFKSVYGTKFKESIRKRYVKQTVLFSNKETIAKVGSPMKVVIEDIIKGSVATLDHLMPKNRDGWKALPNYTLMCKNCNGEKSNYTFSHWLELHPNIGKNMQKFADKIIELINSGELSPDYEKYPYVLAKSLNVLSGGRIILRFKQNVYNRKDKYAE